MKKKNVLALAIAGCLGTLTVQAGPPQWVEIWECNGTPTFADGYTVDVTVDPPYAGIWYQVEDDADGACENFKADDPDFACNKKGEGNLVTSRIDDDTDPLVPRDFDQYQKADVSLYVAGTEVVGDPTHAMVHADVFEPGTCKVGFQCDHDDDAESATIPCYDSGFGGGDLHGGFYDNAFDSCEEAFDETSEGFWAELNDDGGMISPNRNPKKKANGNWAMYVGLTSPSCGPDIEVSTPGYDGEASETPPDCTVSVTVDGIVDGGDYFIDGGTDAGDVTFTPTSNCTAAWVCDGIDGEGCGDP